MDNAASRGYSGFVFPVLPRPIGETRDMDVVPMNRPLLQFDGNTAHSSGAVCQQCRLRKSQQSA